MLSPNQLNLNLNGLSLTLKFRSKVTYKHILNSSGMIYYSLSLLFLVSLTKETMALTWNFIDIILSESHVHEANKDRNELYSCIFK
jgi:hypothetical protein